MTGSQVNTRGRTSAPRVWLMTAAAAVVAAFLALFVVGLPAPDPPIRIPPTLFGIFFYLGEVTVVHVRFRRDAHSFSMSELPLILSLFFLGPAHILLFHFIGTSLALGINRRQRGVKLGFNLAQLSLQAVMVAGVFSVMTSGADPLGPAGWLGVALGVTVMVVVSNTLIGTAIVMSGGVLTTQDRNRMYVWSSLSSTMNAALALVTATVLWSRPDNAWIALIPATVLFFAYRAYLNQRQDRDRLEALYEVSGELHRHPRIDDAMRAAAEKTRHMFNAEAADIWLFPDGPDGDALRTSACADQATAVMVQDSAPDDLSAFVTGSDPAVLVMEDGGARGIAMHVRIGADTRHGVFTVRRPLSDIGSFAATDLRLLETLAEHVAVSLKNGHLETSLAAVTELKDELHRQALRDGLTGLANRRALQQQLEEVLADRRRRAAVVFVDLDDFKRINDSHGHETGDAVLIEVAKRLERSCRPHDTVARLGGDEFAILLENLGTPEDAIAVADRIIDSLATPVAEGPPPIVAAASVGIAMVTAGDQPDDVLRRADTAMYAAKSDGKGRYRLHVGDAEGATSHALASVTALRAAIDRGELRLHYQPIRRLDTGAVVSMEALVRWQHPNRGLIGPGQFIPLAERRGLIVDLGAWVLDAALDTIGRWHAEFGAHTPTVSVNLSSPELALPGIVDLILYQLANRAIDPNLLQIEITESVMMTGDGSILKELRSHGVKVALDDFGTGYSSLAYLDRLPADTIKLDQSFTERIAHPRAHSLVELMVTFGQRMGYVTVAEGIETADQLSALQRLGCQLGQGFHLGRPMEEEAAFALISSELTGRDLAPVIPLGR